MASRDNMPDPRNQPDGANDQDKHGRKQNAGSNQHTHRKLGSDRDPSDDMRQEHAGRKPSPPDAA